jgi:flavodoxin
MQRLRIMYSSTSGHTEHVLDVLVAYLREKQAPLEIVVQHVEQGEPKDLLDCDILLLASSTWNSTEGLLPPDFAKFVRACRSIDLKEKPTCVIGLGDDRYFYTCRAAAHLMQFARERNGKNFVPPLPIVNEPYDQDDKVTKWADKLLAKISTPAS